MLLISNALLLFSMNLAYGSVIKFSDNSVRYKLSVGSKAIDLESLAYRVHIDKTSCNQKLLSDFNASVSAELQKLPKIKKSAKTATLALDGVSYPVAPDDVRRPLLRRVPFDVFTLRQMSDRQCRSKRAPAATTIPDLIERVEKADLNPTPGKCIDCDLPSSDPRVDCIKALCPNDELSLRKLTEEALALDAFKDPVFVKELLPLIDQTLEFERLRQEQNKEVIAKLEAGQTISDPDDLAVLQLYGLLLEVPYEVYEADPNKKLKVNQEKLKRLRADWGEEKLKLGIEAAELLVQMLNENTIPSTSLDVLSEIFSPDDIKSFADHWLEHSVSKWRSLPQSARAAMGRRGAEFEVSLFTLSTLNRLGALPNETTPLLHDGQSISFLLGKLEDWKQKHQPSLN